MAVPFDFKKEYKELYLPKDKVVLIDVPDMRFIMVDGVGDPNNNSGFEQAVELLYALSYAIKMSSKKGKQLEGFFEYVVPPLEGLWWVDSGGFSLTERGNWVWTVMIRQPDFIGDEVFAWACNEVQKRKGLHIGNARLETFCEGLCVQVLHIGPYATEPETMLKMNEFIENNVLKCTLGNGGKHHEIYLSDPRKCKPEQMKTVLRHPLKK